MRTIDLAFKIMKVKMIPTEYVNKLLPNESQEAAYFHPKNP
jgi:hypothetical protein